MHERFNLAEALRERHGCRYGLKGCRVRLPLLGDGKYLIRATWWGRGSELRLAVEPEGCLSGDLIEAKASDAVLDEPWPVVCRCWVQENPAEGG